MASDPESWANAQKRTLARWVGSQIGKPVELPASLADGLTIVDLVNSIGHEVGPTLTPVHRKPLMPLQKMENVDDALKFCRLVLQVNTCNISAEDIVNGNPKLVLGFVWTLFMFSTSRSISVSNETKSFAEIRSILLTWLNDTIKHNALQQLTNFNTDWSFQQQRRPDLIFASIIDVHLPGLIKYSDYLGSKRLANLHAIIAFASKELQISELVVADDFNVLVPDEKCILLYVLQWYMFFGSFDPASVKRPLENSKLDTFVGAFLQVVKLKNRYSTKSLRLSNRMGSDRDCLLRLQQEIQNLDLAGSLFPILDDYCSSQLAKDEHVQRLASIQGNLTRLNEVLVRLEMFQTTSKPAFISVDFPELLSLFGSINKELKNAGFPCTHEPLKSLSLTSLAQKLEDLLSAEKGLMTQVQEIVDAFENPSLSISVAKPSEEVLSNVDSEAVQTLLQGLDCLQSFKKRLSAYQSNTQSEPLVDVHSITKSISEVEVPNMSESPEDSLYMAFKSEVNVLSNRSNLSFMDLKKFIKQVLSEDFVGKPEAQEFIRLIPTRKLLTRSNSDEFSVSSMSDDSDDPDSVFEKASKCLESKLMGAYNKIYDLDMLVVRVERGFDI